MSNFGSLRAIGTASLFLSAGLFQSCVIRSDGPEGQGGSTSGGGGSAGNAAGGATSGSGAAGLSGSAGEAGISGSFGEGGTSGSVGEAGVSGSIGEGGGSIAGIGGSVAGVGGSVAGAGGSGAGVGGVSGCFNEAGSTSAGNGGVSGNGGSNVAGGNALGGGGGSENGGSGGGSSGGAAAGGACSGAEPGCAGMSGSAGAPGGGGSGGSNGDPSLPLLLSTNLINFPTTECGAAPTSKTFTITNPSSVTKAWRAVSAGAFTFVAEPRESSLAPAQVVTVTVTPPFIPLRSLPDGSAPSATGALVINEAGNYQTIMLSEPIAGAFYAWTPASLNFGIVFPNTSATLHLTQSGDSSGRAAGDNSAFVATISPQSSHEWTFTFNATSTGTQTATFRWVSVPYNRPPCTPDTFTATAFVP